MKNRDPERNFEALWKTFHERYPFFELRKVDWQKQYETYRPKVTPRRARRSSSIFSAKCSTGWMMAMSSSKRKVNGESQARLFTRREKA